MKKDSHPKAEIIPFVGKDELNLTEVPFTLLSDRTIENQQRTLEFIDKQQGIVRHWTITGSDKYGLPHAIDESVFIAMLYFTKKQGLRNRNVFFNQREMLQLMRWPIDGPSYKRLELAMSRLAGVMIETDCLWDRGRFVPGKFSFHIINESFLYKGKRKNIKESWFEWNTTIFKSIAHGNLKNLDLDVYFDLKSAVSKRFYRLYDKRLYKTNTVSFDLLELAHEKLGITRNMIYPSELKRKLKPTLTEHKAKELISEARYTKNKSGNWFLTIKKYKKPIETTGEKPLPGSGEDFSEQIENPLLVLELMKLGISKRVAHDLVKNYSHEAIEDQISALPYRKNVEDRSAFLVQAIRESFPLPKEFMRKRAKAMQEKEEELRTQYNKYLLSEVDKHLEKMSQEVVKKEIDDYWPVFFEKLDPDIKDLGEDSKYLRAQCQYDYRIQKAQVLGLPDFEEWKKGRLR